MVSPLLKDIDETLFTQIFRNIVSFRVATCVAAPFPIGNDYRACGLPRSRSAETNESGKERQDFSIIQTSDYETRRKRQLADAYAG